MTGIISIQVFGSKVNYTIEFPNKNALHLTEIKADHGLCEIKSVEKKRYIASNIYFDESGECFYNEKRLNLQFLFDNNKIEMNYYSFIEMLNDIYDSEYVLPFKIIEEEEERKEEEKPLNKKRKFIEENDFIDNEIEKLKGKNRYYKTLFDCVICLDAKKDIFINGCKHLCMCKKCSVKIMLGKNPVCPICRKNIDEFIQVFF